MKPSQTFLFFLTLFTTIHAFALPALLTEDPSAATNLFKRKGGGGGGGRSGGGGSSSSGGKSGSTSSSSSSSSSKGGSSSSSSITSSSSTKGGSTRSGSGAPRAYGGGGYYGGGAAVPYGPGGRSPTRSVAPFIVGGAALAFFPALALYGAYAYNFGGPYHYYNSTSRTNESLPMECYCGRYSSCGCDANNNTDYLNSVANNASVAKKAVINGTQTLVVDGSLQNGTTAPGGTDSGARSLSQQLAESSGLWVVVAGVVYTVWAM